MALGYSGPKANVAVHMRRLERDAREIPPSVERLALMYARHGMVRSIVETPSKKGAVT
jgi:hypothetical protein